MTQTVKFELAVSKYFRLLKFVYFALGIESDYYIAVGMRSLGTKGFPERKMFWCQSNTWQFSLLKKPQNLFAPIFEQIQTFFSGESEKQIVDSKGFSTETRLEEGSVDVSLLPENGLTEQDRLSYVVS